MPPVLQRLIRPPRLRSEDGLEPGRRVTWMDLSRGRNGDQCHGPLDGRDSADLVAAQAAMRFVLTLQYFRVRESYGHEFSPHALLVIAIVYFGDAVVMHAATGMRAGVLGSLVTAGIVLGTTKLAGRGLARLTRYHQRLAHTIETPT